MLTLTKSPLMMGACKIPLLSVVFFFFMKQTDGVCHQRTDCESCAKARSWLGLCRWCPVNEKCHATGSPVNRCSITQNIKDARNCGLQQEDYSPDKAEIMVKLCKISYYNENKINDFLSGYKEIKTVFEPCRTNLGTKYMCGGFSAVSETEKMIIVVFRGSQGGGQTFQIILRSLLPNSRFPAGGSVVAYFKDVFDLIWYKLKSHTYKLIKNYPDYKVYVTGHSLGGAVASLVSTAIVHDGATSKTRTVLYTFGQPRTGDYYYAKKHDELVKASWRVVHYGDRVPNLPPCASVPVTRICVGFTPLVPYHHGTEIFYQKDADKSSYKKCLGLPHNEDLTCANGVIIKCNPFKCYEHFNYLGTRI